MFDRGGPYKDQLEQRNHSNVRFHRWSYSQRNMRHEISDNWTTNTNLNVPETGISSGSPEFPES
jgi:hypothetical protein